MKNNQTLEDCANDDFWYVLQRIRAEELVTPLFDDSAPFQDYSRPIPTVGIEISFPIALQTGIPDPVRMMKIMNKLASDGYIKIGDFDRTANCLYYIIRLNKKDFDELYERYKLSFHPTLTDAEKDKTPKLRFDQKAGVLYRDYVESVLRFGENTLEFLVIRAAFTLPLESRVDTLSLSSNKTVEETTWPKLRDTAYRLNKKIKNCFEVDNFLKIDNSAKALFRDKE